VSLPTPPTSQGPAPGILAVRAYAQRETQAGRPVSLGAMLRILLDARSQGEQQARQEAEMQP